MTNNPLEYGLDLETFRRVLPCKPILTLQLNTPEVLHVQKSHSLEHNISFMKSIYDASQSSYFTIHVGEIDL